MAALSVDYWALLVVISSLSSMSLGLAAGSASAPGYQRHRPEETLLYQLVEQYYPKLNDHLAAKGQYLPSFVQLEFEDFISCGRLECGFLRVRCDGCKHEKLVAFSCTKSRRFRRAQRVLPKLWR